MLKWMDGGIGFVTSLCSGCHTDWGREHGRGASGYRGWEEKKYSKSEKRGGVGLSPPLTLPPFPPLAWVLGGRSSSHAALTLAASLQSVLPPPLCPLADTCRERLVRASIRSGQMGATLYRFWEIGIHSFIHTYFPFLFIAKNSMLQKRLSLEFEQMSRVTYLCSKLLSHPMSINFLAALVPN